MPNERKVSGNERNKYENERKDMLSESNEYNHIKDWPLEEQILYLLRGDSAISYSKLALLTQKSESTIRRTIQNMKAQGCIERHGSKRAGYWKVV
jgi:predicted HTH transcriptional regulator